MDRNFLAISVISLAACAGSPPPPPPAPPPPLSVEEAEKVLSQKTPLLGECYQKNRLAFGLQPPSSYLIRLTVDPDGGPSLAEIRESTVDGQESIEQCLVDILEGARFRTFSGPPLVIDVPVRAPKR